jgi:hypothetical protein
MFPRFWAASIFILFLGFIASAQKPELIRTFGRDRDAISLVEGRDGALYGTSSGLVFRLTPDGGYRVLYDFESLQVPEIVAAEDGHLYGLFRLNENSALFRLSYAGRFEVIAKLTSPPDGSAVIASSLIIGPDGALYGVTRTVSLPRRSSVFRATLEGELSTIAVFDHTPFTEPRGLIVGHDGAFRAIVRVYYAQYSWNETIARITTGGEVANALAPSAWIRDLPMQLYAHPDGNYYISGGDWFSRLSPAGEVFTLNSIPDLAWASQPLLARDGLFYAGRYDFSIGKTTSQLGRIDRDGHFAPVVTGLVAPLAIPRPLVQTHKGDFYGHAQAIRFASSVFRWRASGQTAVNLGPYARPDFARPPAPGKWQLLRVLANDRDVNGDALTLAGVQNPRLGTAAVASDGKSIIYTAPAGDPVAVDDFTYVVSDGRGGRGVGRVSLRANLRGTFNALLPSVDARYDGHLAVQLGAYGSLTGRLWLGGFLWKFGGTLDDSNHFTSSMRNDGRQAAQVTLQVQSGGSSVSVEATIVVNGVTIQRILTSPDLKKATSAAGNYTFAIPAKRSWRDLPRVFSGAEARFVENPLRYAQGSGFGRWRLHRSGVAIVSGKMPDGAPFAATSRLDSSGRLQFFATLYPRPFIAPKPMRGWVRGSVSFRDVAGISDADGSLKWIIPAPDASTYMLPLEEEAVSVLASLYTGEQGIAKAMAASLRVSADSGGILGTLTGTILAMDNRLSGVPPLRLSGKFNPFSGLASGHFARPKNALWTEWSGVFVQKQNAIFGQFRDFDRPPAAPPRRATGNLRISRE